MLTDRDVARWRLRSQHLVEPHAASAGDVVRHLLAVQAENPRQSEWAVAARTSRPDPADLAALLDTGKVVRTHVLRPTWHYALAEDIGWLLDLTAPRVLPTLDRGLAASGVEPTTLKRAADLVVDTLEAQPSSTRAQLAAALEPTGFDTSSLPMLQLMAWLELRQLVCSGRPRDGEHTYDLFERRVPDPVRLEREEGLARLALRYFTSHGPATERDLAYWATLTVTDVRRGLAAARDQLESFEHDGRTFWHAPGGRPPRGSGEPRGHLLQILDELYRGYQDSRMVLDAEGLLSAGREGRVGMALVDGQLLAAMRRSTTPSRVSFELTPHRPLTDAEREALEDAARRYASYLDLEPRLVVT